uniref:Reverse transcriptase domain-containing protein n=1 Tax=Tanacetum cinerariifolium TaxID=118510 RepID=A0A699GZP2_TANCI|nr:hypothetical protein [Tanacetum cinerariifolium]
MILKAKVNDVEPWYPDYVNYIVGKVVPPKWIFERRKRFYYQVKNYFWDEPYAFRLYPDNIMRRCVAGNEIFEMWRIATLDQVEDIIVLLSHEGRDREIYRQDVRCLKTIFRTAYKTPTGCNPFRLVYGKACHLPMEIKHKAYWVLKKCNMDLTAASKNPFMQLNE